MSQDEPQTTEPTPTAPTMQDPDPDQTRPDSLTRKFEKMNMTTSTFSIWPPTTRTRDAVTTRLIETLSTPSVLSKRYGTIPPEEASLIAKAIEEEAYAAATANATTEGGCEAGSVDEGIDILQVYSKEISKRMLDAVKSRATTESKIEDGAGDHAVSADVIAKQEEEEGSSAAVADADDDESSA